MSELPKACEKCGSAYHFTNQHDECEAALKAAVEPKEWKRANYVAAPHFYNLNQACSIVNRAYDATCYLVGSSLERKDYRDVDVRLILFDVEYDRLFRNEHGWTNAFWSLTCTTISAWLSQQSGLQVDFQIQRMTSANEQHRGKRSPLGIFLDYPGDRPSETKP